MKNVIIWVISVLLLIVLAIPTWANIQKAVINTVKYEGIGTNASITIEGSILSDESGGVGYLEAYLTLSGKDYKTQYIEIESRISDQSFRFSFRSDDFRFIDHQKSQLEVLPSFQPEQVIVIYLYEKKITSGDETTVDAQNEIKQRGYALRGILAKKTFTIPSGNEQK